MFGFSQNMFPRLLKQILETALGFKRFWRLKRSVLSRSSKLFLWGNVLYSVLGAKFFLYRLD